MTESIWDGSFISAPLLNFIPSDGVGHSTTTGNKGSRNIKLRGKPRSFWASKQLKAVREIKVLHPGPAAALVAPLTSLPQKISKLLNFRGCLWYVHFLLSKPKNTWKYTSEDLKLSQYIFNTKNTEIGENRLKFKNWKNPHKTFVEKPKPLKTCWTFSLKKRGFLPSLEFFSIH